MSIQALNWVLNQDSIDNSGARFVLLILANYADESGVCYPKRETIARKTSMTTRAVQNHLNWLIEHGYITSESRRYMGKQSSNLFRLKIFADFQSENFSAQSENSSPCDAEQSENSAPSQSENSSPYYTSQAETSQKEFNHHAHTAHEPPAAVREETKITKTNGHLSEFSLAECLRYVEHCQTKGEQIKNPKGLATHLYKTGESDAFIRAALFPEHHEQKQLEQFGPPRKFTEMPCSICGGTKYETVEGKGARPCPHCINERGRRTGLEPLDDS